MTLSYNKRRKLGRPFPKGKGTKGETKCVDIVQQTMTFSTDTNHTIGSPASLITLNLINTGAGFFNRVGRKIAMKSIHITGNICTNSGWATAHGSATGGTSQETYARLVVVYDAQPSGTLPSWTNVFQSQAQDGTTLANDIRSGINLDYRDRFKIIADKRLVFPGINTTGGPTGPPWLSNNPIYPTVCETSINIYRKLKNLETQYQGVLSGETLVDTNPATILNIASGSLLLFTIGDGAANAMFQCIINARLRFEDA